jgi:phosphotriesterase-related protein
VVTVLGPIEPADLGVTLSHDHLILDAFALWGDQTGNYAWILDDVDVAIQEIEGYLAAGGKSVIDPTNEGIGRNPSALRRISEATGAHIVMGAGWYRERCYPRYIYEESVNQLADRLVTDLTETAEECAALAEKLVAKVAALPPIAVRGTKKSLNALMKARANEAFELSMAYEFTSGGSEDILEAVKAFKEKRKPVYHNR